MPLIEPAVTYARADDDAAYHPDEEFLYPVLRAVLVSIEFLLYQVAEIDAQCPTQAVPTYTPVTYRDEDWVNVPRDVVEYHLMLLTYRGTAYISYHFRRDKGR